MESKIGSHFICQLNYLIKLLSFYHPKYCRLTMSYCSCEHGLFLLAGRKKRGKNVCSRLLWQLCPFSTAGGRRGGVGGQQTEDDRNLKSLYLLFIICICSCGSSLAREKKTKNRKKDIEKNVIDPKDKVIKCCCFFVVGFFFLLLLLFNVYPIGVVLCLYF